MKFKKLLLEKKLTLSKEMKAIRKNVYTKENIGMESTFSEKDIYMECLHFI